MHPQWFKLAPSLISRAFTDESCAELCKTQHQFHSELCIPLCILKPGIWGQYLQDILSIFWMVICYSNLGSNQGWHPLQYINTILKLLPSLRCKTLYYITCSFQVNQAENMDTISITVLEFIYKSVQDVQMIFSAKAENFSLKTIIMVGSHINHF